MSSATLTASAKQAESVIKSRISKIGWIKTQLKLSYAGYSENTGKQKAAVFFLVVTVLAILVSAPALINALLSVTGNYYSSNLQTFGIVALYFGCLYIGLFTANIITRLIRISEINGYISDVNRIEKNLNEKLDSMSKATIYLDACIQNGNKDIVPVKDNFDEDIDEYESIADDYKKSDDGILNGLVKAAYWISTILFGIMFITITGHWMAAWITGVLNKDIYSLALFIYGILALGAFIGINIALFKNYHKFGIGSYLLSCLSGPIAIPALWLICGLIYLAIGVLIAGAVIGVICILLVASN